MRKWGKNQFIIGIKFIQEKTLSKLTVAGIQTIKAYFNSLTFPYIFTRKQANSRERNVKNYRQALKVLGLQVQTNEKQREVRPVMRLKNQFQISAPRWGQGVPAITLSRRFCSLSSVNLLSWAPPGRRDSRTYTRPTRSWKNRPFREYFNGKVFSKILVAAKNRFKKTGKVIWTAKTII